MTRIADPLVVLMMMSSAITFILLLVFSVLKFIINATFVT